MISFWHVRSEILQRFQVKTTSVRCCSEHSWKKEIKFNFILTFTDVDNEASLILIHLT